MENSGLHIVWDDDMSVDRSIDDEMDMFQWYGDLFSFPEEQKTSKKPEDAKSGPSRPLQTKGCQQPPKSVEDLISALCQSYKAALSSMSPSVSTKQKLEASAMRLAVDWRQEGK